MLLHLRDLVGARAARSSAPDSARWLTVGMTGARRGRSRRGRARVAARAPCRRDPRARRPRAAPRRDRRDGPRARRARARGAIRRRARGRPHADPRSTRRRATAPSRRGRARSRGRRRAPCPPLDPSAARSRAVRRPRRPAPHGGAPPRRRCCRSRRRRVARERRSGADAPGRGADARPRTVATRTLHARHAAECDAPRQCQTARMPRRPPTPPAARPDAKDFCLRAAALAGPAGEPRRRGRSCTSTSTSSIRSRRRDDGPLAGQRLVVFLIVVDGDPRRQRVPRARAGSGRSRAGASACATAPTPTPVPATIRRRVLNAPLANTVLTQAGWTLAGRLLPRLPARRSPGSRPARSGASSPALVLVGGPLTSALTFLVSEFYWRRQVPVFFPDGRIERDGRAARADPGAARRHVRRHVGPAARAHDARRLRAWSGATACGVPPTSTASGRHLVRTQVFIVVVTGLVSLVDGVARRALHQPSGAGAARRDGAGRDRRSLGARARCGAPTSSAS